MTQPFLCMFELIKIENYIYAENFLQLQPGPKQRWKSRGTKLTYYTLPHGEEYEK